MGSASSLSLLCVFSQTHVEDGDDGRVVPADYVGNVLSFGDLRGDQLETNRRRLEGRRTEDVRE